MKLFCSLRNRSEAIPHCSFQPALLLAYSVIMPIAFMERTSVRLSAAVAAVPIPFLARRHTRPLRRRNGLAAIIPGDSVLESTTIGGTVTFFNIYQNVIGKFAIPLKFPNEGCSGPS